MGDTQLRGESAIEFFKELVDDAIDRQGLVAGELTAFYVVQLLAGFVRQPAADSLREPLGISLVKALESGGSAQRSSLKQIGDLSLFMSGFFPDSFRRRLVGPAYYVQIGGLAYEALSRRERDSFAPVFSELAEKFVEFVDVLSEVSERTASTTNLDLLRLYERWLSTGSVRSGHLLVERGIVPNTSLRNLRVQ
jgi:hypothetical protein